MVDKNLSGSSDSFNAVSAERLPFFASVSNLVFLEETKAISDMDKIPFNKIRITIIKTSID